MKISTKGRYGLAAMYQLKENYGKGLMSISEIATKEKLSEAYLEQLFTPLRKSGYIRSERGAFGGYELSKAPEEISIGEIIKCLEGEVAISCSGMQVKPTCKDNCDCSTKDILEKIQEKMDDLLDSVKLSDM